MTRKMALTICVVSFVCGAAGIGVIALRQVPSTPAPASASVAAEGGPGKIRLLGIDSEPVAVEIGENARLQFRLQNASGHAIAVSRVDTYCGCRKTEIVPTNLTPGSEATVTLVYDSAHARPGDATFPIVLVGSDGQLFPADKQIVVRHTSRVQIKGAPVLFTDVPVDADARTRLAVSWPSGIRVESVRAESDMKEVRCDVLPASLVSGMAGKAEQQAEIDVHFTPQVAVKSIDGQLRVKLNGFDGRDLLYTVRVRGNVVGPVAISPATGLLGLVAKGAKKRLRFDLVSRTGAKDVSVEAIQGPSWFDIEHRDFTSNGSTIVDVAFTARDVDQTAREIHIEIRGMAGSKPFAVDVPCVVVPMPEAPDS